MQTKKQHGHAHFKVDIVWYKQCKLERSYNYILLLLKEDDVAVSKLTFIILQIKERNYYF